MPKKKTEIDSALVTETGAANNPNLNRVKEAILKGYKPNRIGKSNTILNLRQHRTAMFENEQDVWAWKTDETTGAKTPRLLFRAGWWLSAEEQGIVNALLEDADNA